MSLPNMVKALDRSREAEVRSNLHSILVSLERFATDNSGTYPGYIHGGSALAWQCARTPDCDPTSSPPPDRLLADGYISTYPRNPFTTGARLCSWTSNDPRFGCLPDNALAGTHPSGEVVGNVLTDPNFASPDTGLVTGSLDPAGRPYYFLGDGDPTTQDWLPGQFIYRTHGELLRPGTGDCERFRPDAVCPRHDPQFCGLLVNGSHCTSGPPDWFVYSYFVLAGLSSKRSLGKDYLHCYDPTDGLNGFGSVPERPPGCSIVAGSFSPRHLLDHEPTYGTPDLDADGDTDEIPNVVFQEAGSSLVVGGAIAPYNPDGQADGLIVFWYH